MIDFSDPVIQMLGEAMSMGESEDDEEAEESLFEFLGGMITIESAFTPQLIGDILNANITFHINEILNHYLPQISWLIDTLFDDIYFKINPVLSAYVEADLKLNEQLIQVVRFDQPTASFEFSVSVPEVTADSTLALKMDNFVYGLNFRVNWIVGIDFADFINWMIMDDVEMNLATWPSIDVEITPLGGSVELCRYQPNSTTTKWILVGKVDPDISSTTSSTPTTSDNSNGEKGAIDGMGPVS